MLTLRFSLVLLTFLLLPCPTLIHGTTLPKTEFPPCQLGQIPSSRIPYGYPGPRAQNPQQTGAPYTNPSRLQNLNSLAQFKKTLQNFSP